MSAAVSTIKCAVSHWSADRAATIGAALAFYCASRSLRSWSFCSRRRLDRRRRSGLRALSVQLTALFGKPTAEILLQAMRSSQTPDGTIATIVSIATLLLGATTVRCAGVRAGADLRGARASPQGFRGWIRTRIVSCGLILAVGFLLLVSLSLSTALAVLRKAIGRRFTEFVVLAAVLDFVISVGLVTGLIALIYRYMPARRMEWRPILWGALVTAVCPPRTLGDRVVSRPLDATLGVRRGSFVRGDAAVAVLLRADLPTRRRVHGVLRRRARCAAPVSEQW